MAGQIGCVTCDTGGFVRGFAGSDDFWVFGHGPQFFVIHGLQSFRARCFDDGNSGINLLDVRFSATHLVVGYPSDNKPEDTNVPGEKPPVRELLVILLNAVINVLA